MTNSKWILRERSGRPSSSCFDQAVAFIRCTFRVPFLLLLGTLTGSNRTSTLGPFGQVTAARRQLTESCPDPATPRRAPCTAQLQEANACKARGTLRGQRWFERLGTAERINMPCSKPPQVKLNSHGQTSSCNLSG